MESQGHQPKRQGKDWAIRCPFHEGDDTPSLHHQPRQSNQFHCFGCDAGGDGDRLGEADCRGCRSATRVEILRRDDAGADVGAGGQAQPAKRNTAAEARSCPLAARRRPASELLRPGARSYYRQTLEGWSPRRRTTWRSRGLKKCAS